MKYIIPAIRFKIFMTLLLGLIYPLAMTVIAQVAFPKQSQGDFLHQKGQVVGAKLIAQKFTKPEYFWPRPSSVDFNPLPSGGSNLGPTSQDLKKIVDDREAQLRAAHPDQKERPPQDLLFSSASGLDPHISPEAARYQMQRVAKARGLELARVQEMIDAQTEERQWGIFGEVTVNVLALNLALDQVRSDSK